MRVRVLIAASLVSLTAVAQADPFRPGEVTIVSKNSAGEAAEGLNGRSDITPDGRFLAFMSSGKLVPEDSNSLFDIYRRDLIDGTLELVSLTWQGQPSQSCCVADTLSISDNGRYVAFTSSGDDFVPGDTNETDDVFLRDLQDNTIVRASVDQAGNEVRGSPHPNCSTLGGDPCNLGSYHPLVSADGRYIAFDSYATTLVAFDFNGEPDAFHKDLRTGAVTRISSAADGSDLELGGSLSDMTSDGRRVVFWSRSDFVSHEVNGEADVFVRDLDSALVTVASVNDEGSAKGGWGGRVSEDGEMVAFSAWRPWYDSSAPPNSGVFVRTLDSGVTHPVPTGEAAADDFVLEAFSPDGRFVVTSTGTNFVRIPPDPLYEGSTVGLGIGWITQTIRHDRLTGDVMVVSRDQAGQWSELGTYEHYVTNGGSVVFTSSQPAMSSTEFTLGSLIYLWRDGTCSVYCLDEASTVFDGDR